VAVRDAHNRLRYLVGITSDVTVRRNAEDTVRSTAATMRTLVDTPNQMISHRYAQARNN
jgi:hypothetical protein